VEPRVQFWSTLPADLRAAHPAGRVALTSTVPLEPARPAPVDVVGHDAPSGPLPLARRIIVSDGFFTVAGAMLVAGRDFTPADRQDARPVVIVNETFVRERLGGDEAVGQQLRVMPPAGDGLSRTVIGVAPDFWPAGEE